MKSREHKKRSNKSTLISREELSYWIRILPTAPTDQEQFRNNENKYPIDTKIYTHCETTHQQSIEVGRKRLVFFYE